MKLQFSRPFAAFLGFILTTTVPFAAHAQSTGDFSISGSVQTMHVAGFGFEYRFTNALAVLARVEGLGRNYAAAGGLRFAPFVSDAGLGANGIGMAGLLGCRPILFQNCREKGTSLGLGGGAGVSFPLSERWSAGFEAVYWHSPSYDQTAVASGQDDRFTLGGVFRLRL